MSKIVFFSNPAYGHLTAVFPIIKKLVEEGNEVKWYCTEKYKDFVKSSGAEFVQYRTKFEELYSLENITSNFYNLLEGVLELNRKAYNEYFEEVKSMEVDLILHDSMCSFAKNISDVQKIKHICFVTTLAYNIVTYIFSNMFLSTFKLMPKYTKKALKIVNEENKFRRKNGIRRVDLIDIFVNKADKTIVLHPIEFQPFHSTFSKNVKFVGTTINDRFNLDKSNYPHYDVYISMGTIASMKEDIIDMIQKSEYFKDKKIIINGGKAVEPRVIGNIEVVSHTNQVELLKNCGLFINHGGINSVYESLYYSVPQICIPQQEEQRQTAKIIRKKRLGYYSRNFDIKKIEIFASKISKYQKNIDDFGEVLRKYDGTKGSLGIINNMLKK